MHILKINERDVLKLEKEIRNRLESNNKHLSAHEISKLSTEVLKMDQIVSCVPTIEVERLNAARNLLDKFIKEDAFPYQWISNNGIIIPPPVLEKIDYKTYLILDGMHRVYARFLNKGDSITAVVIERSNNIPPPGKEINLNNLILCKKRGSTIQEIIPDFNVNYMRWMDDCYKPFLVN